MHLEVKDLILLQVKGRLHKELLPEHGDQDKSVFRTGEHCGDNLPPDNQRGHLVLYNNIAGSDLGGYNTHNFFLVLALGITYLDHELNLTHRNPGDLGDLKGIETTPVQFQDIR